MPFEHVCAVCGNRFTNQAREAAFCTRACFHVSLRTLKPIPCADCGVSFRPIESNQRLCSQACKSRMQSRLFANRIEIECGYCGKKFGQKPSLIGLSRFCSRPCKHAAKTAEGIITAACEVCGSNFNRRKSHPGQFCSRKCTLYWRVRKRGPSIPEQKTKAALEHLGISFLPEHPILIYLIDFYLPDHRIALEVDGVYWHSLPKTAAKDIRRDSEISALGITVVRITDTEINKTRSLQKLLSERLLT